MSDQWQLAQLNIGTTLYPVEDPRMEGFTGRLDTINALAEASPGFVWRMQSESGNATDIPVGEDPLLIANLSVWETVEALYAFTYQTTHREVMTGRRQWFQRPEGAYQVLWWVPAGHRPTLAEAMARLEHLREEGPGPRAFTFKASHPPPGSAGAPTDLKPEPYCSGWN